MYYLISDSVHGTVFNLGIPFTLTVLILSIAVAATTDFMVSQIGQIAPLPLDLFGTTRDTIKSIVEATGIKKKIEVLKVGPFKKSF